MEKPDPHCDKGTFKRVRHRSRSKNLPALRFAPPPAKGQTEFNLIPLIELDEAGGEDDRRDSMAEGRCQAFSAGSLSLETAVEEDRDR